MNYITFRNKAFWNKCKGFIPLNKKVPDTDVTVLGYFPYHTARLTPEMLHNEVKTPLFTLPRTLFEKALNCKNITSNDCVQLKNKEVYICEAGNNISYHNCFAISVKEEQVIIGGWDQVVNWDYSKLQLIDNNSHKPPVDLGE